MTSRGSSKGGRKRKRKPETLVAFINRTAKEVESWPAWMRGKPDPTPALKTRGGR